MGVTVLLVPSNHNEALDLFVCHDCLRFRSTPKVLWLSPSWLFPWTSRGCPPRNRSSWSCASPQRSCHPCPDPLCSCRYPCPFGWKIRKIKKFQGWRKVQNSGGATDTDNSEIWGGHERPLLFNSENLGGPWPPWPPRFRHP